MSPYPTDPALEPAIDRYRSWLKARVVSARGRISFLSRLRRYLRWFQNRYQILPLPSVVSGQAVYLYREDLYRQGLPPSQVRALVYPARLYHTWAVETRQISEPPLPPMPRPPAGRQMKQPKLPHFSVPYVGRDQYLEWAVRQGIKARTLRHYRGTLSSLARWMRDSRGEVLAPHHIRPDLLRRYFRATGRSRNSYDSASYALRSYARWATEAGFLKTDPYASTRRARYLDPAEREALARWLSAQGYALASVESRLAGMSAFACWFLQARRRRLSRRGVSRADITAYKRWLERRIRSTGPLRLSPATARSRIRAGTMYLEWTRT
jgi:hypothetical protein